MASLRIMHLHESEGTADLTTRMAGDTPVYKESQKINAPNRAFRAEFPGVLQFLRSTGRRGADAAAKACTAPL
jgi:hypothetical protein